MKRKKKWVVESKIKRINWKVIPLKDFTDKALWTRLDEERLASDNLIVELEARFGCKASRTKSELSQDQLQGSVNKFRQFKFLDPKVAQNLSVVLGIS